MQGADKRVFNHFVAIGGNMEERRIVGNAKIRHKKPAIPKEIIESTEPELPALTVQLMSCSRSGDNEGIERLLNDCADVNAKDGDGMAALHFAAKKGNTETCALLLEKGADINARNKRNETALHWTGWGGNDQTSALLLREYAKTGGDAKDYIAAKNDHGSTALHYAARYGYTKICELLVEEYAKAGGNVRKLIAEKTKEDNTPLHFAAISGNPETERFLMSVKMLVRMADNELMGSFIASFRECVSQ